MKNYFKRNEKLITICITILIAIGIICTSTFSYAASTEGDAIYTRDELSDLIHEINSEVQTEKTRTGTIQSALNSLAAFHEDDIRWVDLSSNINSDVVERVDEYLRYTVIGKIVILDVGGIKIKQSGNGQQWLTLPNELIPITRCTDTFHYDRLSEYTSIAYTTRNSNVLRISVPDASFRFFGQMIWLID